MHSCFPGEPERKTRWWAGAKEKYRHSDKTGERFYHIVVSLAIGIVGFVIAISTMNVAARYVSLWVAELFQQVGGELNMAVIADS